MAEPDDFPVYLQPLVGFRFWKVTDDGYLTGVGITTAWHAGGQPTKSACTNGHTYPRPNCTCGMYAYHTLREATRYQHKHTKRGAMFCGVVVGRGMAALHPNGWRAEEAAIVALAPVGDKVDLRLQQQISQRYQVPITTVQQLPEIAEQYGQPFDMQQVEAIPVGNTSVLTPLSAAKKIMTSAILIAVGLLIIPAVMAGALQGQGVTQMWQQQTARTPMQAGLIQGVHSAPHPNGDDIADVGKWQRAATREKQQWVQTFIRYARQHNMFRSATKWYAPSASINDKTRWMVNVLHDKIGASNANFWGWMLIAGLFIGAGCLLLYSTVAGVYRGHRAQQQLLGK